MIADLAKCHNCGQIPRIYRHYFTATIDGDWRAMCAGKDEKCRFIYGYGPEEAARKWSEAQSASSSSAV